MRAFMPGSPGGIVGLAEAILDMEKKDHDVAVAMCGSVKEAILSLSLAVAIVTHFQNKEEPILVVSEEEESSGVVGHTPAELLELLSNGFGDSEQEAFDSLIVEFGKHLNDREAERLIKAMPKDFTVSDFLGEGKGE